MAKHIAIGKKGEALAVAFFKQKGYTILETNWRHSHYELDIIASYAGVLHIIEVKTRTSTKFGHPDESVTPQKFNKILEAAEAYLFLHTHWKRVQYDVLSILLHKEEPEYFLIEDFYLA
jgi:putative endonuclease